MNTDAPERQLAQQAMRSPQTRRATETSSRRNEPLPGRLVGNRHERRKMAKLAKAKR